MKFSTNANQRSSTAQEFEIQYFCDSDEINEIRLRFSLRFSNSVLYARKYSKTSVSNYKAIGELSLNGQKGLDLALINATGLSYDDILFHLPYEQLPIVFKFAYLLNCNHKTIETSIGVFAPTKDSLSEDDFNAVCARFTLDDLTAISSGLKILSLGSLWIPKIQSYLDRITDPDPSIDPTAAKIEAEKAGKAKLEAEKAKLEKEKAEKAKLEAEKAKLEKEKAKLEKEQAKPIAISTK